MLISLFALVGISQNWRFTQPYSVTTYIVSALNVVTTLPGNKSRHILDTGPFFVLATEDTAIKDLPPLERVAPLI